MKMKSLSYDEELKELDWLLKDYQERINALRQMIENGTPIIELSGEFWAMEIAKDRVLELKKKLGM